MNTDLTQLTYFVGPNLVYCTRPNGESVVNLIISASNISGEGNEEIKIKEILVRVPTGTDINDLAKDDNMYPVSIQERQWEFKKQVDYYRARPVVPGTKLGPNKSLTFELRNVKINLLPGTAVIEIVEVDEEDNENSVFFPINKIKSTLDIDSFTADVLQVTSGEPATLTWKTTAAASVAIFPREQGTTLDVNGSEVVHPLLTTTYTLIANGADPAVSQQVTITVLPPKINRFEPDKREVDAGGEVTLSWEVGNAHSVTLSPGHEQEIFRTTDSIKLSPLDTTTYVLTARNKALQTVDKHEAVSVKPVTINSFTVTPDRDLLPGDTVQLSWDTQSVTSAYILPGGQSVGQEQLRTGTLSQVVTKDTDFTLIAQNNLGVKVKVANASMALRDWHVITSNAPLSSGEAYFRPIVLNYDGMIWVIYPTTTSVYKSADGRNWQAVSTSRGALPWGIREELLACVCNGRIWVLGGSDATDSSKPVKYFKDVWSSTDGLNWIKATDNAPWDGRRSSSCFVLNNRIFISGGILFGSPSSMFNDVWSTADGNNWIKETDRAFEKGLFDHKTVILNNKAWVITNLNPDTVYTSTDGKAWQPQTEKLPFSITHRQFSCCVANDEIYVAFNDPDSDRLYFWRMNRSGLWQQLPVPAQMQTAFTAWVGFKNMPLSLCGRLNSMENRSVVAIVPKN